LKVAYGDTSCLVAVAPGALVSSTLLDAESRAAFVREARTPNQDLLDRIIIRVQGPGRSERHIPARRAQLGSADEGRGRSGEPLTGRRRAAVAPGLEANGSAGYTSV